MATTQAKPDLTEFRKVLTALKTAGVDLRMEDPATPPAPPAPTAPEAKFTQADIDRMIGQRLADERKNLATALGGLTPEEAAAAITKARETERAGMDEATRLRTEAEEKARNADRATTEAAQIRHEARIEKLLVRAKADPDLLDLVAPMVQVAPDSDEAAIVAAIEAVKTRVPAMFGTGATPPPPPPGSTPPAPPSSSNNPTGKSARERGMERAVAAMAGGNGYEFGNRVLGQ